MGYLPESDFVGVHFNGTNSWEATFYKNNKKYYLGSFPQQQDAIAVRKKALAHPENIESLAKSINENRHRTIHIKFDPFTYISDEQFCNNAEQLVDCYKTFIRHKKSYHVSTYDTQWDGFSTYDIHLPIEGQRIA